MLFHARALAGEGVDVDLVGTEAGELPAFIRDNSRIAVHALADAATRGDADASARRSLIAMFGRGIRLLFSLARLLVWRLPAPSLILFDHRRPHVATAAGGEAARPLSGLAQPDQRNARDAVGATSCARGTTAR
jgi:hypothetical protein